MENTEQNQAVSPAPSQDLVNKVQAAKALVTAHSLLGVGMFQHRHNEAVTQSLDFLAALHKQILTECLEHPDAHLVQDLVDYAAEAKKQEELKKLLAEQAAKTQE